MIKLTKDISLLDLLGTPSNIVFIIGSGSVITQYANNFVMLCKENIWLVVIISLVLLVFFYFSYRHINCLLLSNKVRKFYNFLNTGDYKKAWNLLSNNIKKDKWNDDFQRFKNGYIHTEKIGVYGIYQLKDIKNEKLFLIVYNDVVNCFKIKGIEQAQELQIKEFDIFSDYINGIAEKLNNRDNALIFKEQKIMDFFEPNFSDKLRWQYNQDYMEEIMENRRKSVDFVNMRVVSLARKSLLSRYRISNFSGISF